MTLPDIHAPERGSHTTVVDESVGKVIINGNLVAPDQARQFAEKLLDMAEFAYEQGTRVLSDLLPSDGILLAKAPTAGWDGTFATTVKHLLSDLLSDGEGVEINVRGIVYDGTDTSLLSVNGFLVLLEDEYMVFEDGHRVAFADVEAVQVPA